MSMGPVVHVVDDDEAFRKSVGRLLRACRYDVKEYESAQHFLDNPVQAPGCIVLDVQMPRMSGLDLQKRLAEDGSALPVVFLTGHGDVPTSVRAMRGGAEDFLPKPARKAELLDAIERAFARSRQACAMQAQKDARQALMNRLSPREWQVLTLVIAGRLNKQIAHELGTTERTIKAHRHNMMTKLNARSLAELFAVVEQTGTKPAMTLGKLA
ncbi:MAG TPA: response regulator [Pseudorhodoplanes sp.]|nr:response regulator [Pseudorhodoplanes sp.]